MPNEDKLALPSSQKIHITSGITKSDLSASKKDAMADPRGYNELMDVCSLHQLIIRKGTLLE